MARLQFYIEAYLFEGRTPGIVLEMCSSRVDITNDGHFSTALIGIRDLDSHELTIANAGHPTPLIVAGEETRYIDTTIGPPLGVSTGAYVETSMTLPAGSALFAFTDGLIEGRGEHLEVGLFTSRRIGVDSVFDARRAPRAPRRRGGRRPGSRRCGCARVSLAVMADHR
jgi:serine phosphatase RsbU (regulator of sigma subunit)